MKAQLKLAIENNAGLPRWIRRHPESGDLVAANIYNNTVDKAADLTDDEVSYLQDQVRRSNYELILFDDLEAMKEALTA